MNSKLKVQIWESKNADISLLLMPNTFNELYGTQGIFKSAIQYRQVKGGIYVVPTDWSIYVIYSYNPYQDGKVDVQSWVEKYQPEDDWYIENYWFPTATFYTPVFPLQNECNTGVISQSELEVKSNFTAMAKVENKAGQEVLQNSFSDFDDEDKTKTNTVVPKSTQEAQELARKIREKREREEAERLRLQKERLERQAGELEEQTPIVLIVVLLLFFLMAILACIYYKHKKMRAHVNWLLDLFKYDTVEEPDGIKCAFCEKEFVKDDVRTMADCGCIFHRKCLEKIIRAVKTTTSTFYKQIIYFSTKRNMQKKQKT